MAGRIRLYSGGIIRLSFRIDSPCSFSHSPMLAPASDLHPRTLRWDDKRGRSEDGQVVVNLDQSAGTLRRWSTLIADPDPALDFLLDPDGSRGVRVYGQDFFTPDFRDSVPVGFVQREGQIVRTLCAIEAEAEERFAGTGERFAEHDLSGRTVELINRDALGVNSDRAYKNVPFVLSSAGYGVFVHSSYPMQIAIKSVSTRALQFAVESEGIDLFIIGGGSPTEVVRNYRRLTGFPPELPAWTYGTWMSRMTYFSSTEIEEVGRRLRAEQFPTDVLHIDTGWFAKDWVCEWKFSAERFPEPDRFLARLRGSGFRVSLWQNPNIGTGNELLDMAIERGYVGRRRALVSDGGSDFSSATDKHQIDFTNPEAVTWYRGLLSGLLNAGAAAIKTDFGETIDEEATYNGLSGKELRNIYGLLYQQAAFEETVACRGEGVIWARAGWAGCQRYPVHWGGDAASSWAGMAATLRGGLHLGISGFGFWSHDVPGFHGVPNFMNQELDSELFLRWTQFGVLSSHLRYHGTAPREPWEYQEVAPTVREWLRLRYALIPYLVEQAREVAASGLPMLRSLIFHFPNDRRVWHLDDQYMLGNDLLVAPVLSPGGRRAVYIPAGTWIDFFDGESVQGPIELEVRAYAPERLPLFVRMGARIPVYPDPVQCTDEMDWSKIVEVDFDAGYGGLRQSALSFIDL